MYKRQDIADRSLGNYIPGMKGHHLSGTQITGGRISTSVIGSDGGQTTVEMYSTAQYEKPDCPHAVVTASDGSQWYRMASGSGAGAFYDAPTFGGTPGEAAQVSETFPNAPEGTVLRTVGAGEMEATTPEGGTSMWYNCLLYTSRCV